MQFYYPLVLLLFVPLVAYAVWIVRRDKTQFILRLTILSVLVVIAAGPLGVARNAGQVLVLILDRSGSTAEQTSTLGRDLVRRARVEAEDANRLAVIGFGQNTVVEQFLDSSERREHYELRSDRSNLFGALRRGLEIVPEYATPRFVVLSDGMVHDSEDTTLFEELSERNSRIDFIAENVEIEGDIALTNVEASVLVSPDRPFHVKATVNSSAPCEVQMKTSVGNQQVFNKTFTLDKGDNLLEWDVSHNWVGVSRLMIDLIAGGDSYPPNNTWELVVRSPSGGRILWLGDGKAQDRRIPKALGLKNVQYLKATSQVITEQLLSGYETVVLNNVSLDDVGAKERDALHSFVSRFGGGLLVLGGKQSFAAGGYRFSVVDEMLPVSLHPVGLVTHRPVELALVADFPDWDEAVDEVKATLGLLSRHMAPTDSLSINASLQIGEIDYELTKGPKPYDVESEISMRQGGGFSFYNGDTRKALLSSLVSRAMGQLDTNTQTPKHLLVVSDGSRLFPVNGNTIRNPFAGLDLSQVEVTLLVIGMKGDASQTVNLGPNSYYTNQLRSLANLPASRVMTTESITDLKAAVVKYFQEITKTEYVPQKTPVNRPGEATPLFNVAGLNPASAREAAEVLLVNGLDRRMCVAARHHLGAGRVATFCAPVAKEDSDALRSFLSDQLEWCAAADSDVSSVGAVLSYTNQEMTLRLSQIDELYLTVSNSTLDNESKPIEVKPELSGDFVVPITVTDDLAFVRVKGESGKSYRLPPISMPRSPEFITPLGMGSGKELLVELADKTGGRELTVQSPLFDGMRTGLKSLTPALAWVVLGLMIVGNVASRTGQKTPRLKSTHRETEETDRDTENDVNSVFEVAKKRTMDRLSQ